MSQPSSRRGARSPVKQLERIPAGVHVALTSAGQLAAFSAHGGNNHGLGWFGPAGTLDEHRGEGLGAAFISGLISGGA